MASELSENEGHQRESWQLAVRYDCVGVEPWPVVFFHILEVQPAALQMEHWALELWTALENVQEPAAHAQTERERERASQNNIDSEADKTFTGIMYGYTKKIDHLRESSLPHTLVPAGVQLSLIWHKEWVIKKYRVTDSQLTRWKDYSSLSFYTYNYSV